MTMYDYCMEQPKVLQEILEHSGEVSAPFTERFLQDRPDRLYLIASGSSLNAALAAQGFMEAVLGIEVQSHAPSCLPIIRGERPMIVLISQGGNSTNTIAAIETLKGHSLLALTGSEACRINELCSHVLIRCGVETAGPKTKGYTATVLTLYLMALEAAKAAGIGERMSYDKAMGELGRALFYMEENLSNVQRWYRQQEEALAGLTKCVVVGKHAGAMSAKEAALKLQETLLIPVGSYEFEEFLHGPSMALDEKMGGIYLMPGRDDPDYQRMEALVKLHRSICPLVYDVSGGKGSVWYTGVFAWCPTCQMIGALLPEKLNMGDKGLDLFHRLDDALGIKFEGRV